MVTRVIQPTTDRPIIEEDGSQSVQMRVWTQIITNQALIIGTGSPDSVVEATQGAAYMNDAGVSGTILYIKRDNDIGGDTSLGWVLV